MNLITIAQVTIAGVTSEYTVQVELSDTFTEFYKTPTHFTTHPDIAINYLKSRNFVTCRQGVMQGNRVAILVNGGPWYLNAHEKITFSPAFIGILETVCNPIRTIEARTPEQILSLSHNNDQ